MRTAAGGGSSGEGGAVQAAAEREDRHGGEARPDDEVRAPGVCVSPATTPRSVGWMLVVLMLVVLVLAFVWDLVFVLMVLMIVFGVDVGVGVGVGVSTLAPTGSAAAVKTDSACVEPGITFKSVHVAKPVASEVKTLLAPGLPPLI